MIFRFSLKYLFATIAIFLVEVAIATVFKHIFFVRAYLGDVIVVALIYTFILSFFDASAPLIKTKLIAGIFIFSVFIEVLQYFKAADLLGFKQGSIPYIVLGNSFSWIDILCYAVGCLAVWIFVRFYHRKVL